jgi:hypothetical protein
LQEGKLLDLFLELPLRLLPPPLDIGRYVEQAARILLRHLLPLAAFRKLTLENSNPLSEALFIPTSRGQHRGSLHPL